MPCEPDLTFATHFILIELTGLLTPTTSAEYLVALLTVGAAVELSDFQSERLADAIRRRTKLPVIAIKALQRQAADSLTSKGPLRAFQILTNADSSSRRAS